MKLLLVFALCGVACCLAEPSCSSDEITECYRKPGPSSPFESEDTVLATICRQTNCLLELYERCGTEVFIDRPFPVKGNRRFVNAFCDRSNPLRKKYLENVKCLRSATVDDNMQKMTKLCDIVDRPKEEFCRKIPDGYKCAVNYITEECGKDAGDVFQVAILPYMDRYDCLSSSPTYDF